MLFFALAAGGAAVLEVHRAIASKASSDPDVMAMRQRERELKEALLVRSDKQFPSSAAPECPGTSAPVAVLHNPQGPPHLSFSPMPCAAVSQQTRFSSSTLRLERAFNAL